MAAIASVHLGVTEATAGEAGWVANPAGDLVMELENLFEWAGEVHEDPCLVTWSFTCDCPD